MPQVSWLLLATLASCGPSTSNGGIKQSPVLPALTHITPDAQAMLDAWTAAVGGRDAIERLGAWHAKGSYTRGGVTGTIEIFQSPRGARREVIEQGFLREERVFDGTHGWLLDRNREVRELAGFELDDQRANAFFGSWAALVPTRLVGSVSRAPDGSLVLTPERGKRPDTVTFDAATHVPVTLERQDGEKRRTTTLGDWRVADGVRVPFTVREDNGNANDAVEIRWTSFAHAELDSKLFERPADRAPDQAIGAAGVTVPIEVVYGGLIFVKVAINDVPMSFIFDTGAEATVLNSSRLAKLGLQGFGTFATGAGGGDVALSYVKGVTSKLGDAIVRDQIVASIMLDQLEGPLRRPLDGILGYDFISRFVFEIDYAHQTMRLYDRATYHHAGSSKPLPISLEDSTPFIDAAIEVPGHPDLSGHFVLDTGCLCDLQLFAPFVDTHDLLTTFPEAKQAGYSAGAGGTTHELSATIPALKIGAAIVKDPKADFSRDTKGAGADPESAGLIGSVTFGHFVLVLDYKHGQAYLDPVR